MRKVKISFHTQGAVLVIFQGAEVMTIKILCNIVEFQFSMAAGGLMDILPGKHFYVYIANLTATPVNLLNFRIAAFPSNTPASIVHARDDLPSRLGR